MASHSHSTKISFAVAVQATLRAGEQIGLAVTDGAFDTSQVIPLLPRLAEQASSNPSSPIAGQSVTIWETLRPVAVSRGSHYKYKYAILNSAGAFVSWEKLPGTVEHRALVPHGKLMAMDDVFGELEDDVVQRQLDENAETSKMGDVTRAAQIVNKLKAGMGESRKLMIVSYTLPVILRKHPETHAWSATWIEDDVLARTTHSIADDIKTIWVGCITRECIDLSPSTESKRTHRAHSVCDDEDAAGEGTPSTVSSREAAPQSKIITKLTAGGVDIEAMQASDSNTSSVTVSLPSGTAATSSAGDNAASAEDDTMSVTFTEHDMVEITRVLNAMDALPIFLPSDMHEAFACYCMSVLKPCMNNVLETGAQKLFPFASSLAYLTEGWANFKAANEVVASVIFSQYAAGDVVWTNDYPLLLVPKYLVTLCKEANLPRPAQLFFWHSTFPTSEIFRTLSVRDDLLEGIIQCDVIGFHTFNYARHFLQSLKRLLGINFQSQRGGNIVLDVDGREVLVSITHVGIEAEALDRWMASSQAAAVARSFADKYRGKIILAGIDTCQRLSGVALKLLAFERLLEENPIYRKQVVLVQRCEMRQALIADMKKTSAELRERVERIKAAYGDVIDYEEAASYSPTYRVGLFHQADIFLQTPIREGLNMIPLEYVYVRTRWQILRSKMLANASGSDAMPSPILVSPDVAPMISLDPKDDKQNPDASPVSVSSTPLVLDMSASLPSDNATQSSDERAAPFTDAALKAMTTGMPDYYATLAAAPSALGKKDRARLSNAFRKPILAPAEDVSSGGRPAPIRTTSAPHGDAAAAARGNASIQASPTSSVGAPPGEFVVPVDNAPLRAPLPPPARGGCIMLSEFSTASQILNSNLVFNPWSIGTVCKEIDKALTMPDHERSFRQWRDYKYAIRNPAGSWSRQVVLDVVENYQAQEAKRAAAKDLVKVNEIASSNAASTGSPHDSSTAAIIAAYKNAKRRVIVLDYGGTLIERDARETKHGLRTDFSADGYSKAMPKPVMDGLACLSQTTHNTMYVVSGLRSAAIDALHLSHLNGMGLAAENGSFVSHPSHHLQPPLDHHASSGGALAFEFSQSLGSPPPVHTALHSPPDSASQFWPTMGAVPQSQPAYSRASVRHSTMLSPSRRWIALTPSSADVLAEWNAVKPRAVAIMNEYQWRVNGSSVRIYESLVAWDFRNADPEWAQAQATHLAEDLESLASDAVKVSIRKSRVEISLREMNKGQFVQQVLNACPEKPDFIMIVGDDVTDEEMFSAPERFFQPSEEPKEDAKTVKSPHPVELPPGVFTVHVGREEKQTRAAYLLPDVSALQRLIVDLANVTTPDVA